MLACSDTTSRLCSNCPIPKRRKSVGQSVEDVDHLSWPPGTKPDTTSSATHRWGNRRTLMGKMMEQIHQLGIPMGCTTFREALMIYQKTHMENQFDKVEPSSQKVGQERCSGRTRASMDSGSLWRHGLQILCTSQGYLMALGTKVPLWLCHQLILRMCCPVLQVAAHLPVMSNTFIVHWVLLQPLLKFQSDCLKWLP